VAGRPRQLPQSRRWGTTALPLCALGGPDVRRTSVRLWRPTFSPTSGQYCFQRDDLLEQEQGVHPSFRGEPCAITAPLSPRTACAPGSGRESFPLSPHPLRRLQGTHLPRPCPPGGSRER
jgi:hypothetical protein